jgi:hypothetical protein
MMISKLSKGLYSLGLLLTLIHPSIITPLFASGVSISTSAGSSTLERTAVVVDEGLNVSYTGSIDGLLVSIQNGFSGDVLTSNNNACTYNASTYVLTCSGSFTSTQAQALLRGVTFNTTASDLTPRKVDFVLGKALPDPESGRFYEYFEANVTWEEAFALASTKTLFGLQGYLATIPNARANEFITTKINADPWVGGSDDYRYINEAVGYTLYANQSEAEGYWYWVSGPEKGTMFYNHRTGATLLYSNWASGEPNNFPPKEEFLQLYSNNQGRWNDLPSSSRLAYVVAYGGFEDDPEVNLMATKTVNVLPVVSYHPNGATSGSVPLDPTDYQLGDLVSVLANTNLLKTSSVFLGWSPTKTGLPLLQAGDSFELLSRTTLFATWFSVELEYEVVYFPLGRNNSMNVNYVEASGAYIDKGRVILENPFEGDVLSTWASSGAQSYWFYDESTGNWSSQNYVLSVTQEDHQIIFETDMPIPSGQFDDLLSSISFMTSGEIGVRHFTFQVDLDGTLIEATSRVEVVEPFKVSYVSDKYQDMMPTDTSLYVLGDTFCPYTPYDLRFEEMDEDEIFIGYTNQYGVFMTTNTCHPIIEDVELTAVFTSLDALSGNDRLVKSNTIDFANFLLPEGYLEYEFSWLEYYEFYVTMLVLNTATIQDFTTYQTQNFVSYLSRLNNVGVQYFFIKPQVLYYSSGNPYPYVSTLYFYGDYEEGMEIEFKIPEALQGYSNYRLFHLDEDQDTLIETTLDTTTWVLTFKGNRFSPYALIYDLPTGEPIPDTNGPVNMGLFLILAGIMLQLIDRKLKA